jgi:hypothetical protein
VGLQVLTDGDRVRTGVSGVGEFLDHLTGGVAEPGREAGLDERGLTSSGNGFALLLLLEG